MPLLPVSLLFASLCGRVDALHAVQNHYRDDARLEDDLCADEVRVGSNWPVCGKAPWKPPNRTESSADLCDTGKALPRLYVLGAQKTGTSSFANDLACAGIAPVPSKMGNQKEFSYFIKGRWAGRHEEKIQWMKLLPKCEEGQKVARVVADFTPNNLRMVPGEVPYSKAVAIDVPETLHSFYGHHASSVNFVAMIRNPLSRMQSAWYAARACHNHAICTDDCKGTSFKEDLLQAIVNAKNTPPVHTEWLWTSMYYRHLTAWLKKFQAKQFYVIPYLAYAKGNANQICRDLSHRLSFHMDCESHGRSVTHDWANPHPKLEDDVPKKLATAFDNLMREEIEGLVKLLAKGKLEGMGLACYSGEGGQIEEVRQWLVERW